MSLPVRGRDPPGEAVVVVAWIVCGAVVVLVQGGAVDDVVVVEPAVVELVDDGTIVLEVELPCPPPAKDWIAAVVEAVVEVLLDVELLVGPVVDELDVLDVSPGADVDVLASPGGHWGGIVEEVVGSGTVDVVVDGHGAVVVLDPGTLVLLEPPATVTVGPGGNELDVLDGSDGADVDVDVLV